MANTERYELFKVTAQGNQEYVFDKRETTLEVFGFPVIGVGKQDSSFPNMSLIFIGMILPGKDYYRIDNLYLFKGSGQRRDLIPITGNTMFIEEIYPHKAGEKESSQVIEVVPIEFNEKDMVIKALDEIYRSLSKTIKE